MRLHRQRADDIVGLEGLRGEDRHAERFTRLVHPRNLFGEVGRHRRPVGLVVGGHLGAEGRAGQIERRGDVARVVILHQLPQHRDEDVDRMRAAAAGAGQTGTAHRVIRAVHLRAAVDQEEACRCGHRASGAGKTNEYIIRGMSVRVRAALLIVLIAAGATAACGGRIFAKQYEYEEDLYLATDGSADLIVNASIPALVSLRGLTLDTDPAAQVDRDAIRAAYESPDTDVTRVSRPWRRDGRRFVQV